jgi:hypothetical protein
VDNLLTNPGFEMPKLRPTVMVERAVPGPSAGSHWEIWNNSQAITTTDILPSTRPGGGAQMMHVCTTGPLNGLVATFPSNPHVISSVWVFVVRGQVVMGTGNGGATGRDKMSMHTGEWEKLEAPNGGSPANEFIVYSVSPAGACYYVDDASVQVP